MGRRVTSGASRNANPRLAEMRKDALSVDIFKRDVRGVRQSFRSVRSAVEPGVRNLGENSVFEFVAHGENMSVVVISSRKTTSGAQSDDVRNCRSASPTTMLLRSASSWSRE